MYYNTEPTHLLWRSISSSQAPSYLHGRSGCGANSDAVSICFMLLDDLLYCYFLRYLCQVTLVMEGQYISLFSLLALCYNSKAISHCRVHISSFRSYILAAGSSRLSNTSHHEDHIHPNPTSSLPHFCYCYPSPRWIRSWSYLPSGAGW